MLLRALASVALLLSSAWQPASAQVVTEPGAEGWVPAPAYEAELRPAGGPMLGVDIGLGVLRGSCELCPLLGGLMVGAYSGLSVHPRVAIAVDTRTTVHPLPTLDELSDGILMNGSYAVCAQAWVSPVLWLRAGAGLTLQHFLLRGPDLTRWGPTAVVAIGSEQRHRPDMGVDLSVHIALTRLEDFDGDPELLLVVTPAIGAHWH